MEYISNGITSILIESGAISEKERKLYTYCISGVVEMGINIILTLALGLILGKFIETLVFLLILIPLRSRAGGYHASNGNTCFVLSILVYLLTILITAVMSSAFSYLYSIPIFVITTIGTLALSPVDCKNKRLNNEEKRRQRKNCVVIMSVVSVFFSVMTGFQIANLCFLISTCIWMVFLLLIAGRIQNLREE